MIIDGEKWACEACVRGHRVSNCQHHDRPLQHINKKGRPVSQCQHCRAMRKSRSAHVKCDCGEKTHKCVHLRPVVEGHKESCCCNHGGRCTCVHKREPQLDTVPESDSDGAIAPQSKSSKASSRARRRANTTNSDVLSFDAHGHHKPTYKHVKASQKAGPYQLNRVNSMHSTSSRGNHSMDDLVGPGAGDSETASGFNDETSQAQRRVKSEAASPLMAGSSSFAQLNGQLPPLDLSGIKYTPYVPNSADFFGAMSDHEQPMFSAGLSAASVDWSNFDGLGLANNADDFAPSSYSQAPSYSGLDFTGSEQIPTMTTTTSTSGEVSEVEDFLSNTLDDFDTFQNTVPSNSYGVGHTHTGLVGSTDFTSLDFEYNLKKAGNKFLPMPSSMAGEDPTLLTSSAPGFSGGFTSLEDDSAFWMNDYTGLPNVTDSPTESNMPSFWDGQ
ncbi:Copper resistance protein CRF1 [Madurella mycetomatis]|uniref:Copper resistance protein CRF1 n=1 Tax=Madurella mycetomatis TaxID=100816 RepID=A0A175VUU1_9PEZI|nr:Copper resistance protein CRF1 [Madurella mycetomatis]